MSLEELKGELATLEAMSEVPAYYIAEIRYRIAELEGEVAE